MYLLHVVIGSLSLRGSDTHTHTQAQAQALSCRCLCHVSLVRVQKGGTLRPLLVLHGRSLNLIVLLVWEGGLEGAILLLLHLLLHLLWKWLLMLWWLLVLWWLLLL